MKTLMIQPEDLQQEYNDMTFEDDFFKVLTDYHNLESHVVYFSAGDSKIKEILIKKEPTYSA